MAKHRYRFVNNIGGGGTGVAFQCKDIRSNTNVVVKRFFPDKLTKSMEKKVYQEPKLKISSDYLVLGEKAFSEDGILHLVMPFVEGDSMRKILDSQNSVDEAYAIYTSLCLCRAAYDAHAARIILTDLKPDNMIITPKDYLKIIDISCFEHTGSKAEVSKGTFPYSAPELIKHGCLCEATDTYSIAVILFEMLIGGEDFNNITNSWDLSIEREVKPGLSFFSKKYPEPARIVSRAIEPKPGKRYKDAYALYDDLYTYYSSVTGTSVKKLVLSCSNGRSIQIKEGRTIIGRSLLSPSNSYISQKHFEIDFDGAKARIKDLNSLNYTSVNGTLISKKWFSLKNTDVIFAANEQITVRID